MYTLTRTSEPPILPITLTEAKEHLRVFHASDDVQIDMYLRAAVNRAQDRTGRQMVECGWLFQMPCWPAGKIINLPVSPLKSVESVVYLQPDDMYETIDPSDYHVITELGAIWRTSGNWPTLGEERPDAVQISYTAGHMATGADSIPDELKVGILQSLWHYYDHRGEVESGPVSSIPKSAESIFDSFNVGDEFEKYGYEYQYGVPA